MGKQGFGLISDLEKAFDIALSENLLFVICDWMRMRTSDPSRFNKGVCCHSASQSSVSVCNILEIVCEKKRD